MNIFSKIIALVFIISSICACDTVSEDERYDGPLTIEAKKNVLIEDFTGQRCVNCPYAAQTIASIQETYGADRVIAVAIHGGSLAVSETASSIGLANEQGMEYNTHWNVESWPSGLVDRMGGLMDYEKWNAQVINRFSITPKADLTIENLSYDAATRELSLTTNVTSTDGVDAYLQVWLTESNIVRLQTTPTGNDRNYVHNHVFRASVNDPYGDPISLTAGQSEQQNFSYTLKEEWEEANMSVVVFVYNETDGVIQVIDQTITD